MRIARTSGLLCCAAVLVAQLASAAAAPRGMTAVDMVELTRLSRPSLSPDGTQVIYLRSQAVWEKNKAVNRYRLTDLESGATREVLAVDKPDESFGGVYWRPDGEGFITLLDRDGDADPEDDDDEKKQSFDQAYFYSIQDDSLTRLTDHPEDVKGVAWAPDGAGFFFVAERPDSETFAAALKDKWAIREYETRKLYELWYFDWQTRSTKRLLGGDFNIGAYEVSLDGKTLVNSRSADALPDAVDRELWRYDIAHDASKRITNNAYRESKPALSPDATRVAYIATVNEDGEPYYEDNVFVQTIGEPRAELLLPDAALEVLDVAWDSSGDGLFVLGNSGLRTHVYRYDLARSELTSLTRGDVVIDDWTYDPRLDSHVFLETSAANPGEVWVLKTGRDAARRVSSEYAGFSDEISLPKQVAFSWTGRGSVSLEGLLVYPLEHEPGKAFPLVTVTHGGPRSSAQFGAWNVSRYVSVLAAQGYGVFLPNHRGGTGYGDAFMRDMVGGYFTNAHHDVLDGIDALVAEGLVDPKQLIKMGWSAGGHMTNKLITVTDRFRAASSGAGGSDWVSLYAGSDVRHNRTPWFGGAPWEAQAPLDEYVDQSILKDAWRVKTPTLFFTGQRDIRVPPLQAIMMYRGVKAAGTETELFVAPGQKHNYSALRFRLFKINRELKWYARHLGREAYVPVYPDFKYKSEQ